MKLSSGVVLLAILTLIGCGGGVVTAHPPVSYIGFVNYNVDLANPTLHQKGPACVYAYYTDEYFVTWEDARDGVDYDIYARFFDTLRADPASTEILLCTASGDQLASKAAYNSQDEEFLVVWEDYNAGDSDIWGQLVDAVSGALIGSNFPIATTVAEDERDPQVTYNPDLNEYLITWDEDTGGDRDILGIIIYADGTADPAGEFVITPTAGDQQSAVVAYDTINDRYMVAFMDFSTTYDLYGQIVAYDGGLVGSDFEINTDSGDQEYPAIAFNLDYGRFLVTWEDNYLGDYDITAQEVQANGLLLHGAFIISPNYADQNNVALTYNDYQGEYIIVWEDERYGSVDIFGQSLSAGAMQLGGNVLINDDAVTSISPALCSNTSDGEFLATWAGLYSGDYDILGQILY